jgi:hypothetical protein
MKQILVVFLALSVLCIFPEISRANEWAKAYGGSGPDWMSSLQETPDGGCIVAGYTESFGYGDDSNLWVMKLVSDGSITWEKAYSGVPYDWASSVRITADGGYIIAGYTECFGSQGGDVWLIKVDSSGGIVWETRYGGDGVSGGVGSDEATSIQETIDGYIVAGRTKSFGGSCSDESTTPGASCISDEDCPVAPEEEATCLYDSDVWVLKLDTSGDITWEQRYGNVDFDIARAVEQTSDGGYIVAGDTWHAASGTTVNSDMVVLKLDSDGSIEWQKTYGDIDSDTACCIEQTPDGGYILLGDTRSFTSISDIWVLKLTSTGTITWQKTYGGNWSYASALDQTVDGGYIVAGHTHDFGAGLSDIVLLKLDSTGFISWQKVYGGSEFEWAHAIEETLTGEYLVAGRTQSFGAGSDDALLLKVDSNGDIPDCSLIGVSTMVATDTSIDPVDSTLVSAPTTVTTFDTVAWADDISVEVKSICPLSPEDSDEDGIPDQLDNCPEIANPGQEDTFPPGGNSCGDICECEGNFDGDEDVDGADASQFKTDFGRSPFTNECEFVDPCNGDFDCDGDADGTDASQFKTDFGRSQFTNPCPSCETVPWCTY